MPTIQVALLASDRALAASVARAFAAARYECAIFASGRGFREGMEERHIDLLVIGPVRKPDAAEAIREARRRMQPELPIMLLASSGEKEAIERALLAGANDYLCLPLRPAELKTRAAVLLARAYPERVALERMRYGEYEFDQLAHRLSRAGKEVPLTRREFDLALLLFKHLGQPLSRTTLGESVWGHVREINSRTIDTHVSRVRSKLRLRPENGYRLAQVYGYGYRLEHAGEGAAT